MRTIEVIEFRDVTGNSEDGFSARLRFRLTPPRSVHAFKVSLTGTVAAPLGLPRGAKGEHRDKAMAAMFAAANKRILQDPRHELPIEEEMRLEKRDVKPFIL